VDCSKEIADDVEVGEQLKAFFSPALVRRLAGDLIHVHPAFSARTFVARATTGLEALELLDRGRHIARVLAAHLPSSYPEAVDVLLRSLGPEHASDELIGIGMAPFYYLPHTIFVAEHGLDHFEVSMRAQYELTKRFSAESSIRPFISKYPERTLEQLRTWALDPNPHVRRLVSEGTRLRLPWAARVAWLDEHPEQVLALLELLKDDPASVVRRSVANNLNDLGKVHPGLLMRTCESWLAQAPDDRRVLVEHALRSAVKRGEPAALRLLGYGQVSVALDDVRIAPRRVPIGDRVAIEFTLRSRSRTAQDVLVDLGVHFIKANGRATPKVFKLKRIVLPPRGRAEFSTSVSLAVHTTRKPQPGRHTVNVIVNGTPVPAGGFDVVRVKQEPRRGTRHDYTVTSRQTDSRQPSVRKPMAPARRAAAGTRPAARGGGTSD
jgi:3-methyladenine DNA glycosylase AlkC